VRARIAILAAALASASCFNPDYLDGKLRCAVTPPRCPDGYRCAVDGACWRRGSGPATTDWPAAVWISSGGGSVTGSAGLRGNFTFGGGTRHGAAQAVSGAHLGLGYISSDTYEEQ
jgi:hypothetical protein